MDGINNSQAQTYIKEEKCCMFYDSQLFLFKSSQINKSFALKRWRLFTHSSVDESKIV